MRAVAEPRRVERAGQHRRAPGHVGDQHEHRLIGRREPGDGGDLDAVTAFVDDPRTAQAAAGDRQRVVRRGGQSHRCRHHAAQHHLRRDRAVPLVALDAVGDVEAARLGESRPRRPHPEADGAAAEAAELDRAAQVLALAHPLDPVQRRRRGEQRDARVAQPERLERGQLLDQLERNLRRCQHRVDVAHSAGGTAAQHAVGVLGQRRGERGDLGRVDGEPRGGLVTAVAQQMVAARGEPGVQVVAGHAASGALGLVVADGDQHDRPPVALDQPRSHDPDHALVPVAGVRSRRRGARATRASRLDQRDRLLEDRVLDRLAIAVELLELRGELAGAALVGRSASARAPRRDATAAPRR